MLYKSKKDAYFIKLLTICLVLILTVFLVPYLIDHLLGEGNISAFDIILLILLLLLTIAIVVWPMLAIRYVFHDEYLFVRGGPFRSKIRYEDITKVEAVYFSGMDMLSGYRIMMARDGIEIHYKTALLGSVRISPERKEQFLQELEERRAGNS